MQLRRFFFAALSIRLGLPAKTPQKTGEIDGDVFYTHVCIRCAHAILHRNRKGRATMSRPNLELLFTAIVDGDAKRAVAVAQEAVAAGVDPQTMLTEYMIPAMDEVGARFEANECFVPELLISARAMKAAMEVIRPLLLGRAVEPAGRVVIATVQGDLHDIGKNLVATMLEGGGFQIVDVGVDVSPDKLVEAVQVHQPQIVALSALLTTTMPSMKRMIDRLVQEGLRQRVKVMVGGAPVTQEFAEEIGADGYSDNAAGAVTLARRFVGVAA